jgi:subtilisin family serine protease
MPDGEPESLPAWGWQFVEGALTPQVAALRRGFDIADAFGDRRGHGVRVAVVDSGIEDGHPSVGRVQRAVSLQYDAEATGRVAIVEEPHADLYGHGTACGGIIREIAPDVELVSVRVLGTDLKGRAEVFAAGLEWAIDQGIDVISLSLSTHNEAFVRRFHDLCDRAAFAGCVLVSALNNLPGPTYPSQFAGVCSVAAADTTDRERWWYRSGGPAEFGAAGVGVRVAWTGGTHLIASGNSFAAPVIAGHAARIVAANSGITPFEVKAVLRAFATNAVAP